MFCLSSGLGLAGCVGAGSTEADDSNLPKRPRDEPSALGPNPPALPSPLPPGLLDRAMSASYESNSGRAMTIRVEAPLDIKDPLGHIVTAVPISFHQAYREDGTNNTRSWVEFVGAEGGRFLVGGPCLRSGGQPAMCDEKVEVSAALAGTPTLFGLAGARWAARPDSFAIDGRDYSASWSAMNAEEGCQRVYLSLPLDATRRSTILDGLVGATMCVGEWLPRSLHMGGSDILSRIQYVEEAPFPRQVSPMPDAPWWDLPADPRAKPTALPGDDAPDPASGIRMIDMRSHAAVSGEVVGISRGGWASGGWVGDERVSLTNYARSLFTRTENGVVEHRFARNCELDLNCRIVYEESTPVSGAWPTDLPATTLPHDELRHRAEMLLNSSQLRLGWTVGQPPVGWSDAAQIAGRADTWYYFATIPRATKANGFYFPPSVLLDGARGAIASLFVDRDLQEATFAIPAEGWDAWLAPYTNELSGPAQSV